ncbi:MAG: chromosome segregation protein SMC [Clostridia bacterium]|nr:chromosome segregation protein SMC [Clostridia bacterium]
MRGFKSFPDKTRMEFGKGITAVVGPNGSGKSNISDAVRWVLGEMSPKSLRGSKMEDVIFSGTAKRSPTGYCEVSLIMDNKGRELAVDTDEVKITRKYFRSGDSEYRINEKTSRLRDIYELFLNTGIGREGYSVVGQGKIAEVISQKSDERRHIFEEAAGISKFRYRKNDASKKLAETDANLVRVTDIATEIGSRIGTLEKEAENAKKYIVLADRKKELEVAIWFDKITKAALESEKYEVKTAQARENYEIKERELDEFGKKTEELSEKRQTAVLEAETIREELSALEAEKANLESLRSLSQNDIAHHEATRNALGIQIKQMTEEVIPSLEKELSDTRAAGNLAKEESEAAYGEKANAERVLDEKRKALSERAADYEKASALLRAAEEKVTNAKISKAAAENAAKSESDKRSFIDGEIEKAEEEKKQTEILLKVATDRKVKIEAEKAEISAELAEELKEFDNANARHDAKLRERNEQNALLASDLHRKEMLERMDKLLEGYPGSVKAVVNEPSLRGICGPVSRLINSKPQYVTAIETSLGAAVSNIVTEDEQSAKDAIRFLKEQNAGRATFLPLTSIKGSVISQPGLSNEKGYIGIASDLVSYDAKFESVAQYLLGRTLVTDDIDNASVIARKYGYKFRIVTLDGQLINAGGSYTGGSAAKGAGIMSRGADIEKLEARIKKTEAEIAKLSKEIKDSLEEREEAQSFIEGLRNDLSNTDSALYKNEGDIKLYTEKIAACDERIAKTRAQLDEYSDGALSERITKLTEEQTNAEAERNSAEESLKNAQKERENAEDAVSLAEKELSDRSLNALAKEKDYASALDKIKGAEVRLEEANAKLSETKAQDAELEKKLSDAMSLVEGGEEKIAEAGKNITDCRARLEAKITESNDLERNLTEIRNREREIMNDKEVFYKELTRCESILANNRETYDTLTAKLFEEYELTYSEAKAMNLPSPTPEFTTELASVKAKIRALGSVNVNAVEEYKETKERYDFMTAQINDLNESKKSLESVISRLEKDMKVMFSAAMEKINESFKDVFVELFGGGSAEIVITEPDNILESGIEINIQPPGKMVKSLSLLSGGEQAFTAIALYFAILKVNPAPFYIFDEIEAALDDVNVARFGKYLRRNSKSTQFIVITHRRGTMESADTLYGVTMQEKGVSNFLKVNIEDVEKKTGVKLSEH